MEETRRAKLRFTHKAPGRAGLSGPLISTVRIRIVQVEGYAVKSR